MPLIGDNAGSLLPGALDTLNAAYDPNIGPAVNFLEAVLGFYPPAAITTPLAQSVPDFLAGSSVTLTAGSVILTPLYLRAGQTISKLSIITAVTAASTPTHAWAGLASFGTSPLVLAISADGLTTAIAADSLITYTLGTAYVVPTTGFYYGFICVAGTAGPTAAAASLGVGHGRGTQAPYVSGPGDTGKTTPYAVGGAVTAPTAGGGVLLMYAN